MSRIACAEYSQASVKAKVVKQGMVTRNQAVLLVTVTGLDSCVTQAGKLL